MTRRHHSGHSPQGASPRRLRVGEELRHALSSILVRGEMRDPNLRDCSITVTEVRMSPDLREARVFVLPLGGENTDVILSGLKRAAPYLRTLMARAVQLRLAPTLIFSIDSSFDQASRVDNLLREHVATPSEKESDDG